MNDRYLFRAKRTDNGEWVEGYLLNVAKLNAFICTGKIKIDGALKGIVAPEMYAVDPSTICQCTGFSDEVKKKIFEGDIVGFIDCTSTENGYSEQYCRGQVTWDKETASFQVTELLSAESYEVLDRGCKVLGNIFDNAELMEEW